MVTSSDESKRQCRSVVHVNLTHAFVSEAVFNPEADSDWELSTHPERQ